MTRNAHHRLALVAAAITAAALLPASAGADPGLTSTARGSTELVHGWQIQSSAVAVGAGPQISRPGYSTAGWFSLSQPETIMAGLLENGKFPDIFSSTNI